MVDRVVCICVKLNMCCVSCFGQGTVKCMFASTLCKVDLRKGDLSPGATSVYGKCFFYGVYRWWWCVVFFFVLRLR